jgi:hypothetical protein
MRTRTALVVAGTAVGGAVLFRRTVRPWMASWGATTAEIGQPLPADVFVHPGVSRTTRAITIDAPVSDVWRWLVQIGEDQAGFYSYTWLERLARTDMRNADRVNEAWQHREVGDTIWLGQRWGERGRQVAAVVEPERALAMVSPADYAAIQAGRSASGYWGFFLEPIDATHTRLIVRSSGGPVGNDVFDLVHFVMEQKMMRGLKQRAERAGGRG